MHCTSLPGGEMSQTNQNVAGLTFKTIPVSNLAMGGEEIHCTRLHDSDLHINCRT